MVAMTEGIAGYAGDRLAGKCSRVTVVLDGTQSIST
jgi:hypothetical protein